MKDIFDKKQLEQLDTIAQKYRIADVYVFGSQVDGFAREDSDVDMGVRFRGGLPKPEDIPEIYGHLYCDLSELTGGKKLDLVLVDEAPIHFQFRIVNEGRLLFSCNLEDTYNFHENIVNKYRDLKYFIDDFFEGIRLAPIR